MKIKELTFKNIKSYGNKIQKITFDDEGGLILLTGTNGVGKCLSPDTEIDIDFIDNKTKKIFEEFMKNK